MHQDLDEQALAKACSEGVQTAEDELYTRYAARVLTLCRRYCGNRDDALDLMQETLLKALEKISTYKYTGKGSLYGWISRIAINGAINDIKRRRWRTVSLDFTRYEQVQEPTENEMIAIPQEKLLEWISTLPDMRRMVFNMYCIDGYSHKEISELLGISEKGSASELAKARKQLKDRISRYIKETES